MVNPINTFYDNLHCQTIIVENDTDIIGVIKAECHEECVFLHPKLYTVNKSTLKLFKETFNQFTQSLHTDLYYDHCYADTKNSKWVKFLTSNKAKEVSQGVEGVLYEYDLRQ